MIAALHATLADFRARAGYGRAIAAPQIGESWRIIAVQLGGRPLTLIDPQIDWCSEEYQELWDDCLSVPTLVCRMRRYASVSLGYRDEQRRNRRWDQLPAEMAELVQHEIDHLDGILMSDRVTSVDDLRPIAQREALIGAQRAAHRLEPGRIQTSSRVIAPEFLATPQYRSPSLDAALGLALTLKVETLNPIRSFKGRGRNTSSLG